VPVAGWDFSWFDGRATEERLSRGYAVLLSGRIGQAQAVLDIQTGGGEVLASAVRHSGADDGRPQPLAATESWPPNVALARRALEPLGGVAVEVSDDAGLPFPDASSADPDGPGRSACRSRCSECTCCSARTYRQLTGPSRACAPARRPQQCPAQGDELEAIGHRLLDRGARRDAPEEDKCRTDQRA
jgi:hypothetical protein